MIVETYDFRGGYASDLAPQVMPENMVLEGQNLYWKGKLKGRPGWDNLSTDATLNGATIQGFCRAYINSSWMNIVAVDNGSNVQFYRGDTGSYTVIQDEDSQTYSWTTATQVELRAVPGQGKVIAVNGTDKPCIIYYDSAYIAKDLEAYDVRTRGDDEWYAGLWDNSETPPFVDDTSDAQSTTADDFQIATTTANDGFYIAGVTVFNKVVIKNCPQLGGSPVAEYTYYAGNNTWTAVSPTTTPNWTAAEGDKTLEFDLPFGTDGTLLWDTYGDLDSQSDPSGVSGGALNRYIFRIRFTTAPSGAASADYLQVSNTQYLSQLFLNEKPALVEIHKDRVFLSSGNAFRFSPPNAVTGWYSQDIEYCDEGGEKIRCLVSARDYLAIFKDAAVYRYHGTTTNNFTLRKSFGPGCTSPRGAAFLGNVVIYTAKDGIRVLAADNSVCVSRHIQTDYDGWTTTDTAVVSWDGNAVISFPTDGIILWADPDTIREDNSDAGEGRLSFWEWTGASVDCWDYASGSGDNGNLLGWDSSDGRILKDSSNGYDVAYDTTETNVTNTLQLRYDSHGAPGTRKMFKRQKVDISKSGEWTVTLYADEGQRTASRTIQSGTGTGHFVKMYPIPYTLDGRNLSVKLVNATSNAVEMYGVSTESERRVF